jgi:hypothetical protein
MSHVGLGITEAYWEYRLKPWDMAAGVLVTFPPAEIPSQPKYSSNANDGQLCDGVHSVHLKKYQNICLFVSVSATAIG